MKTSRMIGVLVLAGIAIGAVLSAILPDFGFGLGSGGGIGNPPGLKQEATSPVAESGSSVTSTAPIDDVAAATEEVPPTDVVYVLIDKREYLLRRGPEGKASFKPASLEEVAQAAQAATGDDNGIRVRIAQKSSSRETTERALRAKLEEAGVPGDAIRWKDEPVEGGSP